VRLSGSLAAKYHCGDTYDFPQGGRSENIVGPLPVRRCPVGGWGFQWNLNDVATIAKPLGPCGGRTRCGSWCSALGRTLIIVVVVEIAGRRQSPAARAYAILARARVPARLRAMEAQPGPQPVRSRPIWSWFTASAGGHFRHVTANGARLESSSVPRLVTRPPFVVCPRDGSVLRRRLGIVTASAATGSSITSWRSSLSKSSALPEFVVAIVLIFPRLGPNVWHLSRRFDHPSAARPAWSSQAPRLPVATLVIVIFPYVAGWSARR